MALIISLAGSILVLILAVWIAVNEDVCPVDKLGILVLILTAFSTTVFLLYWYATALILTISTLSKIYN